MKIFFDFDDTLFDTTTAPGKFGEDLKLAIQSGGWTRDQILEFRSMFSRSAFDAGKLYHYKHLLALLQEKYPQPSFENVEHVVLSFMKDLRRYLFPDVIPALKLLGKENVVLVTYGDRDFQQQKIIGCGIDASVSDVIITSGEKLGPIRRWLGENCSEEKIEETWFVDDKQKYFCTDTLLPRPKTVFMCRAGAEAPLPETDYVVGNCQELLNTIKNNS